MKDLYSFHKDETDLDQFYDQALEAYRRILTRMKLSALVVEASGGAFSKYSHEFQVLTPAGEDIVVRCGACSFAQNREIAKVEGGDPCPHCGKKVLAERAIEVGNIFKLKNRFSDAFHLTYKDVEGKDQPVLMGCYGIGLTRAMGAIVEVHHDDRGIIWPVSVAPFDVHLLQLGSQKQFSEFAKNAYLTLQKSGFEVLYDNREYASVGEKFADADLIGIPMRAIISEKTVPTASVELKLRAARDVTLVKVKDLSKFLKGSLRKTS